jgi:hypothetical protein
MTYLLLRDDDANATTDPDELARIYAPLLDAGLPIAFSVIPDAALDTRAPDGRREAFLHRSTPHEDRSIALTSDAPLARWLRRERASVDVLQHGTTHRRVRGGTEFGALSEAEAQARLARGETILREALGREVDGFVAPWDRLSAASFRAVCQRYRLLSTGWVDLDLLPPADWFAHIAERARRSETLRVGSCRVLRHRGGRIGSQTAPEAVPAIVRALTDRADVAVVVLHHWMYAGPEPHPAIVALAAAIAPLRSRCARARDLPALLGDGAGQAA